MSSGLVIGAEGRAATAPSACLIRSGADLVEVTEALYLQLFSVGLCSVIVGAALDLLDAAIDPRTPHPTVVVVLSLALCAAVAVALRCPTQVYRRLRSSEVSQAVPGLAGAALLLLGPYGPMWFAAMAMILVTAVLSSLRVTLLTAVSATAMYVARTIIPGADLFPSLDRFAAAFSLLVVGLGGHATIQWMAGFVLRLHSFQFEAEPVAPRRVSARVVAEASPTARPTRSPRRPSANRLTARQLEVAVLLRDGLRHSEIAECLSISARQVERHVREARERVGARTASELVAMLVRNGLVPPVFDVVAA